MKIKLSLLAAAVCGFASLASAAGQFDFRIVDGVVYDINATGSKWKNLQGEAVKLLPKGALVRTFTLQPRYALPSRSTVVKVRGLDLTPRIGTDKVYGSTVFVFGVTNLILNAQINSAAMLIGQTTIDGQVMEAWKTGRVPSQAQIRASQVDK